jgi:hypothetical protein
MQSSPFPCIPLPPVWIYFDALCQPPRKVRNLTFEVKTTTHLFSVLQSLVPFLLARPGSTAIGEQDMILRVDRNGLRE